MTYVALLRAVNLPGHNKVTMAELRQCLESLGMRRTQTVLQSGNVILESNVPSSAKLEAKLEAGVKGVLELETPFMVRTSDAWAELVENNPFPTEAKNDPGHLVVMLLKTASTAAAVTRLQRAIKGPEVVRLQGQQLYVVYPEGIGTSRLTTALIERTLETTATGRNWNTVQKLLTLAQTASRAL